MKHLSQYVEKDPAHEREKESNFERDQLTTENQFSPLASLSPELLSSSESISSTSVAAITTSSKAPQSLSNSGLGNMSAENINVNAENVETPSSPHLDKGKGEEAAIKSEDSKANETKSEERKTKLSMSLFSLYSFKHRMKYFFFFFLLLIGIRVHSSKD